MKEEILSQHALPEAAGSLPERRIQTVYPLAQPGGEAAGSQPVKRKATSQETPPHVRKKIVRP